ncbi:hypothetical protein LC612_00835 [Nostoc sp. CHAB 5834]|nr:hypothetical protein [Nostoc sp. CHAB 5834]
MIAQQANAIAQQANVIAQQANVIAQQANVIAQQANAMSPHPNPPRCIGEGTGFLFPPNASGGLRGVKRLWDMLF